MEELAVTFNNLLDRLQAAFQRERQFIADVAHELKTPLTTLKTGIEVTLARDRTKDEYKHALEEAVIDADRQSRILSGILDIAWSEADNAQNGTQSLNLTAILEELREVTMKLAAQKQISVETEVEKDIYVAGPLPASVVDATSKRYLEAYRRVTGAELKI